MECRLLLVQPSRLSREGLHAILRNGASIIQDVASAQAFLKSDNPIRPDAVIWGAAIPAKLLFSEIAAVQARFYRAPNPVKHVVLTDELSVSFIRQIAILDVEALLHDDISGEVLLKSIELVMLGQRLFPVMRQRELATAQADVVPFPLGPQRTGGPSLLHPRDVALSFREGEILRHLVDGASNKAIAFKLQITEATVKVHVRALLRKIRVANRTQAATWALNNRHEISDAIRPPLQIAEG